MKTKRDLSSTKPWIWKFKNILIPASKCLTNPKSDQRNRRYRTQNVDQVLYTLEKLLPSSTASVFKTWHVIIHCNKIIEFWFEFFPLVLFLTYSTQIKSFNNYEYTTDYAWTIIKEVFEKKWYKWLNQCGCEVENVWLIALRNNKRW